jgi:hypothetical protein
MDVTNTGDGSTRVSRDISGTAAFVGLNNYPVGISRPDGILGRTGYSTSNAAGVAGASQTASGGIGVLGTSAAADGVGVYGFAGSVVPSQVGPAGTGVHGRGPSRGVNGESADGMGVHGSTTNGVGVQGVSTGPGRAALFVGTTRVEGGLEAVGTLFVAGPARVEGILEAVGAVPAVLVVGSDGAQKRTYPVASLAPAFEHVGQARLRRGRATVTLPADFDALVPGRSYQVFLTEYGNLGGLYVRRRNLHSFEVRSRRPGARGVFGYRVVQMRTDLRS